MRVKENDIKVDNLSLPPIEGDYWYSEFHVELVNGGEDRAQVCLSQLTINLQLESNSLTHLCNKTYYTIWRSGLKSVKLIACYS